MTELWLASLVGAALFFGAGLFAARSRRNRLGARMALERTVVERRFAAGNAELVAARGELAAAQAELARLVEEQRAREAELGSARSARLRVEAHLTAARADAAHLTADVRRLTGELATARSEAHRDREHAVQAARRAQTEAVQAQEAGRADRAAAAAELAAASQRAEALRGEIERLSNAMAAQASELGAVHGAAAALQAERDDLAGQLLALSAERDDLAVRVEALRGAQSELARANADRRALLDEVGELRARVRVEPEPADVSELRHELVITSELARARADEAGRVRDENVRLRERVAQLEDLAERFDAVVVENNELRAHRFLVDPPPKPAPEAMPAANAWQLLVQRVSEVRSVRAAVVTDELGLVVASAGEYSDVLAAYGRHLADEGQRVRELLPFRTIRELTVHDDRDVTMTVRPLPVADSKLALVTLGVGSEPDDDVRALLAPTLLEGR